MKTSTPVFDCRRALRTGPVPRCLPLQQTMPAGAAPVGDPRKSGAGSAPVKSVLDAVDNVNALLLDYLRAGAS
jgi:hypothetical protein